ncbi:GATA transcription factor 26-like [Nicotiana tomentosiformis]|uniref:GATA transcription factor 26 n=1 Tax=Nicotiana tabacum TaxID=4097 RepID=A0A1S3Z2W7_TOBAC|nr:GATA transcription factor 26-like [Nicotiana tomentosiformis]XP_016458780.1 PREDICTED: GATA transcription factor 26-like [Nicotiana tabacum]
MGKEGPCYHCGVTSTPLWRNGPPEKPILCNACGSRWRTKGTLANYTPLHARAEPCDFEEHRVSRFKNMSSTKNKDAKVLKRKQTHDMVEVGTPPDYNFGFRKCLDEDTSNRSSSGSVVSNSESCAQFGSAEASDLTGPAQSNIWDTTVPSKKRTCFNRPKPSSVEKLTKDLYTILHEQQQSSCFSASSEEDLLFESEKPMVSVEIGHGSMLIRHPSSIGREESSEASSLSVENKHRSVNEAYSRLTTPPVNISRGVDSPNSGTERTKKPTGQVVEQNQIKRNKDHLENLQILGHHNSPLRYIELKDVLNFEEFMRHLSSDDQQQLLKYLPPVDSFAPPDSLRSMFESSQFEENLSSFQKLLAEGVFDNSLPGVKLEDCRTLKRFILCYLSKSKWVEQYNLLKDTKCKNSSSGSEVAGERSVIGTCHSVTVKRPQERQHLKYSGAKTTMKSPKSVVMKSIYEQKEPLDNDGSCSSPKSSFALPSETSSLVLDSFRSANENSDQDLLLNVPSNSYFPQAELLLPTSSFTPQASTSSSSMYPSHLVRP